MMEPSIPYAKACFTMQEAYVANVAHCPKRATQCSKLYRRADELTKRTPLHVGNGRCISHGAEGMPTASGIGEV